MLPLLLALSLADLPRDQVVEYECHLIEINHYHCPDTGAERGVQVIYWGWYDADSTHHVDAWRPIASRTARFQRHGAGWRESWTQGGVRHVIHARALRETWTIGDPEAADREPLPGHLRTGLRRR